MAYLLDQMESGSIQIDNDVLVAEVDGRELRADICHPADKTELVPAIIFFPGGSWLSANRANLKGRFGIPLARRGYVCITGEYRVTEEAPWPAQIRDVQKYISWTRYHSEDLNIHPSKIAVAGKSAGGHLALLAAGISQQINTTLEDKIVLANTTVNAVIGVSAVSNLAEVIGRSDLSPLLGANPTTEMIDSANPIEQVTDKYPPTMLYHGTSDNRVHHSMSLRMYEKLENNGIPTDLTLYAGQDHSFDSDPIFTESICDSIALFISRYL